VKLSSLIGQPRARSLLAAALERNRVHHAYLFAGPPGVGKETAARAFAAALLCERGGTDACGACASCAKVERGVHPDLVVVLPEVEAIARGLLAREDLSHAPSRELKIEQVRKLEATLALPPLEGSRRAILLLDADQMNVPAQNAFLKTLEEPPPGNVIVLVAAAADRLLPTIRSRCVRVPFGPLPEAAVVERVVAEKGVDPATAAVMAAVAGGSLGGALELDPQALAGRADRIRAVEALSADDLRPLLRAAEELADGRDGTAAFLDLLALFYRDVAASAAGAPDEGLAHRDLADVIHAAARRGPEDALRRARLALSAKGAILRYASPRLSLERMLLAFVLGETVEAP
jgi:DNA polymerase-3 subunit delta'